MSQSLEGQGPRTWGRGRLALTGPAGPAGRAARSAQRSTGRGKASTCSCAGHGAAPPPSASAPGIRAGSPGPAGQTAVPTAAAISPSPPTWFIATPTPQRVGWSTISSNTASPHFLVALGPALTFRCKSLLLAPGSQPVAQWLLGTSRAARSQSY